MSPISEKPRCSIVIRAFNEENHLGRLLSGIDQQSYQDFEVIVVDSGSTDSTVEIANQGSARVVSIDPAEFTFGRSLNTGIAAASGELIVIVSAHCYPVFPDWLEQLLEPFEDDQVASSYGKQRGAETNHFSEHQFFHNYFPNSSQMNQGQPYTHNANAAIRRSLWEKHPYNERLTGLEDIAWSSWAKEQGYSIAYVAEAEVIHSHQETFQQVYNRYRREAIAMKQILPQSHFTFRNMIGMFVRKTIQDWSRAKQKQVLQREFFNIIRFRWLQYLATWRGYRFSGKIDLQLHRKFYYPPGLLSEKIPESRLMEPIDYLPGVKERN